MLTCKCKRREENRLQLIICYVSECLYLLVSRCSEQASLRKQVLEEDTEDWQREPDFSGLERVGGVDLSFIKGDDVNACAQLVVLSYPDLEVSPPLPSPPPEKQST